MASSLIIPLKSAASFPATGGKAQALGKMLRAGFQCPDGFVILDYTPGKSFESQILDSFDRLGSPFVAVRSSAASEDSSVATWAGQFDTFLNVDREHLLDCVQKCRGSQNSARVSAYAAQHNLKSGPVAVIIQTMVQSEISGVAFSIHPVTKNAQTVVIEAAFGLGEAVVSGEVTPDTYIVDKLSGNILEKHLSHQAKRLTQGPGGTNQWQRLADEGALQKLSDDEIVQLAKTVTTLEKFCGFPVDVEWGVQNGELYLLQSRPITA